MSNIFNSDEELADATYITMVRILDVLYSQMALTHPEEFKRLIEKHKNGGHAGPVASFDPSELLD